MNNKKGGSYLWDEQWFTDTRIFDITELTTKLDQYNDPNSSSERRNMEEIYKSNIHNNISSLYPEISDEIKLKIGDDIKKILKYQTDVRYIKNLIEIRNEKKLIYDEMQKQLSIIVDFQANDLKKNNTGSLLIRSPYSYSYFNEGYDSELIDEIINIQLQQMNVNHLQGYLLGCGDLRGRNAHRSLLGRNNYQYTQCTYLKESLENAIYWTHIDLTKQGVGSVKSIAFLMWKLLTEPNEFSLDTVDSLSETFKPFIPDNLGDIFNINIKPVHMQYKRVCKSMFIKKNGNKVKIENIRSCSDIVRYLDNILRRDTSTEEKKKFKWEKFAIFMYGLIQITIETLRKIWNDIMNNMPEKLIRELDDNINTNLTNLRKYLLRNLSDYIKIKREKINDNYGFVIEQDDDYKNPKKGKKKMIRINGGFNSIRSVLNFSEGRFLFTLISSTSGIYNRCTSDPTTVFTRCYNQQSTLSKLKNFIYKNENISYESNRVSISAIEDSSLRNKDEIVRDIRNMIGNNTQKEKNLIKHEPIYVGGFTHTPQLLEFSRMVFIEYYKLKYNIISNEYNYVNLIIKKMKSNIHITEIKGIFTTLINSFTRTAEEIQSQDIAARKMLSDIKRTYFNIRKKEMVAILELIKTVSELKKDSKLVSNDMLDIAYIKYSHYKLKAIILRILSLNLYKQLQRRFIANALAGGIVRRDLPDRYYRNLEALFTDVDNEIKDRLRDKEININSINRYLRNNSNIFKLNNITNKKLDSVPNKKLDSVPNKKLDSPTNKGLNSADLIRLREIEDEIKHEKSTKKSTKKSIKSPNKKYSINLKKLKGETIFIPYIDKYNRHGFFNILSAYKKGKIEKVDVVKGSLISVKSLFKKYSSMGRLCVAKNKKDQLDKKKWRALDGEYIKELIKMTTSELKNEIALLFKEVDIYHEKTMNYWGPKGNSLTKTKVEKYCNIVKENEDYCEFITNWNNVKSIIK